MARITGECWRWCDPPHKARYVLEGHIENPKYMTYIQVCDSCLERAKGEYTGTPKVLRRWPHE